MQMNVMREHNFSSEPGWRRNDFLKSMNCWNNGGQMQMILR